MNYDDDLVISADEDELDNIENLQNISVNQKSTFNSGWDILSQNNLHQNGEIICDSDFEDITNQQNSFIENLNKFETNSNAFMTKCQLKLSFYDKMKLILRWILRFSIKFIIQIFKLLRYIIVLTYFLIILVFNMPYAMLRNSILFLKCYTESPCVHYIPLKLIPAIIKHVWFFIQNSFFCSLTQRVTKCPSQCSNSNSSSKMDNNFNTSRPILISNNQEKMKKVYFLIGGLILVVGLSYFVAHGGSNIHANLLQLKSLIDTNLRPVYMFPGEKCMKAGRCCRGHLEGLFRWISCFGTIPIRLILTIWPKKPFETKSRFEGLHGIRNYIEKITEELISIKDEITFQGELLVDIQTNFIKLAQKIQDKASSINILKPKVQNSKIVIEQMRKDMDVAIITLKDIMTIRNDVDRLQDLVQLEADDAAMFTLGTMDRLHTAIESEQNRLLSQIENLEVLTTEDHVKSEDKNQRILSRVTSELDNIKGLQQDMHKRMLPLIHIPIMYKELSDGLQKDITNKLNEEMAHHEQMSKRTERVCFAGVEKLEHDFAKAAAELNCFVNKTVRSEAKVLATRLKMDVNNVLYDRTVEMARAISEKMILKQSKSFSKTKRKIKKCSLFPHVFNVDLHPQQCLIFDTVAAFTCNSKFANAEIPAKQDEKNIADQTIEESLRLFVADDIGLADFAMESAGGSVVSDRSSATYSERAAFLSLFGLTFGKVVKSIRKIIQPGSLPGECWAFNKDKGHVVIRLAKPIVITRITIDHVSRILTPNGQIESAPKNFNVYALENYEDYSGHKLGEFEYSKYGDAIQTFNLKEVSPLTQYIQVNFLSNHGNGEYTCIYRVRVHGNSTQ